MPSKKKRSLVIPDNLGPLLGEEEKLPMVATGERLLRERPEIYRKCVEALAAGESVRSIKRKLKVSHNTLAVISRREKALIETAREHLQGLLGHASRLAVEQLIDKLDADEIPAAVLPIATGILVDKVRAGEGAPTAITEMRKVTTLDEVKAELERIKTESMKEVDLVDVTEPPHLESSDSPSEG